MYYIFIKPSALKELAKIPPPARTRIEQAIDGLGVEPRPIGCRKIRGSGTAYRLRVGDYRVIYEVHDKDLVVIVVRVGHRKDVYRNR